MPAAEPLQPCCPVCHVGIGDEEVCAGCGWPLNSPYRPGPVSDARRREFDGELAAARRGFDLAAAVRAATGPGGLDEELFERMSALVRGHPVTPDDRAAALSRVPVPAPGPAPLPLGNPVVEVDASGICLPTFVADDGSSGGSAAAVGGHSGLLERAEPRYLPWSSLMPGLSDDPDERRFQLAGGIGTRPVDLAGVADAVRRAVAPATNWSDSGGSDSGGSGGVGPDGGRPDSGRLVVANWAPGWPVPEAAATVLTERWPQAYLWRAGRPGPRPTHATRHPDGLSAFTGTGTDGGEGVTPGTGTSGGADRWLFSGTADGAVWRWSARTGELLGRCGTATGVRVTALAEVGDGAVVSGHRDGAVRLWTPEGAGPGDVLTRHDGWVNAVAVAAGRVFSAGDDGLVRCTPLAGAAPTGYPLRVGFSAASCLTVSASAQRLAVAGEDRTVRLFDARTGELTDRLAIDVPVTALAFDPAGGRLVVGCADGTVRLLTPGWTTPLIVLTGLRRAVSALLVGPSGRLAAGDATGLVGHWPEVARSAPVALLGRHDGPVRALATTVDGQLISAAADGVVRTWRTTIHRAEVPT